MVTLTLLSQQVSPYRDLLSGYACKVTTSKRDAMQTAYECSFSSLGVDKLSSAGGPFRDMRLKDGVCATHYGLIIIFKIAINGSGPVL